VLQVALQESMQGACTRNTTFKVPVDKTAPPLSMRHDAQLVRCRGKILPATRLFL